VTLPISDLELVFCASLVKSEAWVMYSVLFFLLINQSIFVCHKHGPDFDDMSSFFPCEIEDAIQYINLGYGAQAPKIVILL
jgi:hypothetical protein